MINILQPAHSYIAFIALALIIIAAVNALLGKMMKKTFKPGDRQLSLLGLMFAHIQLLIGLILFFLEGRYNINGDVMKDSLSRLYAVEHPLINIIAIVLITIGWSKHKKKTTDNEKFSSIGIFYALGAILILSRIPWAQWLS